MLLRKKKNILLVVVVLLGGIAVAALIFFQQAFFPTAVLFRTPVPAAMPALLDDLPRSSLVAALEKKSRLSW